MDTHGRGKEPRDRVLRGLLLALPQRRRPPLRRLSDRRECGAIFVIRGLTSCIVTA